MFRRLADIIVGSLEKCFIRQKDKKAKRQNLDAAHGRFSVVSAIPSLSLLFQIHCIFCAVSRYTAGIRGHRGKFNEGRL
jgi:hypothetical protein